MGKISKASGLGRIARRRSKPRRTAVRDVREGDLCLRRQGLAVEHMRSSGRLTAKAEDDLAEAGGPLRDENSTISVSSSLNSSEYRTAGEHQ